LVFFICFFIFIHCGCGCGCCRDTLPLSLVIFVFDVLPLLALLEVAIEDIVVAADE